MNAELEFQEITNDAAKSLRGKGKFLQHCSASCIVPQRAYCGLIHRWYVCIFKPLSSHVPGLIPQCLTQ